MRSKLNDKAVLQKSPVFSIVVPAYNRPDHLAIAAKSVLHQDFQDWELLLVDDGTYPPLIEQMPWLDDDDRFVYLRQSNQGPNAARALGATKAKGAWLLFLDDDDWYHSNHLSQIARDIADHPDYTGLLATGMVTRRLDGSVHKEPLFPSSDLPLKGYWQRPVSLLPFAIPSRVVRDLPPPRDTSIIEDFEWLCTLLSRYSLRQLPGYTAVYVEHPLNRTVNLIRRADLQQRIDVVRRVYADERVSSQISRSLFKKMLSHQCWHHARQCLKQGQMRQALASFTEGMRTMNRRSMPELAYTLLSAGRALVRSVLR